LTGKYLDGALPEGSRLQRYDRFTRYSNPQAAAATQAYVALAREAGLDPGQMALAFVNSREFLTSNIIGATTMEQLRSNVASAALTLDKSLLSELEILHQRYTIPAP
jgi:aryl-alcohol dehydrogenase-like predicted oxidoreductase